MPPSVSAHPICCEHCGALSSSVAAALAVRDEQVGVLQEDVGNLERELRGKRAQIKRLKSEQDANLLRHPNYVDAMSVLNHWKAACAPSARELAGRRLENVLARLHGKYTVDDLMRAADGYALKPYVVDGKRSHEGPKDSWHADAELIYRNPEKVDQGIRIAERADDLRQVMGVRSEPSQATTAGGGLSPLGSKALQMAGFGFFVFPCRERDKVPATANGLLNATRDPARIRSAWDARPHLNVAVRTGAMSGIWVLDVDGDEGWDTLMKLQDEHDELPDTLSVTTPRGGQHFYFLHPGWDLRNTAGFPGPGLDVRGDGGYVLAPPSVGPGGRQYEVDEQAAPAMAPEWLLTMLKRYQAKVDQALSGRTDWVAFLNDAPSSGERNTRMTRYVGHLFGVGMDPREVLATALLLNAQASPPLTEKELAAIVKSIARAEGRR